MQFNYAYNGNTAIIDNANRTGMSFSPDVKREVTFFIGELRKAIEFREAISALHNVVISDLRYKPKDKTEYLEWAKQQEDLLLKEVGGIREGVIEQVDKLMKELNVLRERSSKRMKPFFTERKKYFDYLYKRDQDAWFVLDPVITIHPDEVFFECFSQDESTYGRLSVDYEVYKNIEEFSCGTTNIDYSASLYNEFQKIRSYKNTQFKIDPSGFEVQTTNEEAYKEVKIDLPDSWVRGFLQVNSAMCLPMTSFELHPMDVHNFCFILRRYKEIKGPRSIRFYLKPDSPIKVIFEPWNYEVICHRSIYTGDKEKEIRIWGRRRLCILERLIPIAKKFTVHLLGTGMPSFYVADLGDMAFTLGLSGWTANDWSKAGNFDLMAPREHVDKHTKQNIFNSLKENWFEEPQALASRIKLDKSTVLGALSAYAQAGRVIFDLNKKVYRIRELTKDPLPMSKLRFSNPREEKATKFIEKNDVKITSSNIDSNENLHISGTVKEKNQKHMPKITIDKDERLIKGECSCKWYFQNKLYKGPCEHMLALRMFFNKINNLF